MPTKIEIVRHLEQVKKFNRYEISHTKYYTSARCGQTLKLKNPSFDEIDKAIKQLSPDGFHEIHLYLDDAAA